MPSGHHDAHHRYAQIILELLQARGYTAALTRAPQQAIYLDALVVDNAAHDEAPAGCPPRFRIGEPDLSLAGAEEQLRDGAMLVDPTLPLDLAAIEDYVERCRDAGRGIPRELLAV